MIVDHFKCNSNSQPKETHCFLGTEKEVTIGPCPYKTHVVVLSVMFVAVLLVTSYTTFKVYQLEYEVKELRSYAEDTNEFYNYLQKLQSADVSAQFAGSSRTNLVYCYDFYIIFCLAFKLLRLKSMPLLLLSLWKCIIWNVIAFYGLKPFCRLPAFDAF